LNALAELVDMYNEVKRKNEKCKEVLGEKKFDSLGRLDCQVIKKIAYVLYRPYGRKTHFFDQLHFSYLNQTFFQVCGINMNTFVCQFRIVYLRYL
jgi:hypothetical protein